MTDIQPLNMRVFLTLIFYGRLKLQTPAIKVYRARQIPRGLVPQVNRRFGYPAVSPFSWIVLTVVAVTDLDCISLSAVRPSESRPLAAVEAMHAKVLPFAILNTIRTFLPAPPTFDSRLASLRPLRAYIFHSITDPSRCTDHKNDAIPCELYAHGWIGTNLITFHASEVHN